MKRFVAFSLKLLPGIVFIVIVAIIVVTNQFVALGHSVGAADASIDELREENDMLRQEIASASSLLTIETLAQAQGFIPATHFLSVGTDAFSVAVNLAK
jgi:cell division protein FtsL